MSDPLGDKAVEYGEQNALIALARVTANKGDDMVERELAMSRELALAFLQGARLGMLTAQDIYQKHLAL